MKLQIVTDEGIVVSDHDICYANLQSPFWQVGVFTWMETTLQNLRDYEEEEEVQRIFQEEIDRENAYHAMTGE